MRRNHCTVRELQSPEVLYPVGVDNKSLTRLKDTLEEFSVSSPQPGPTTKLSHEERESVTIIEGYDESTAFLTDGDERTLTFPAPVWKAARDERIAAPGYFSLPPTTVTCPRVFL